MATKRKQFHYYPRIHEFTHAIKRQRHAFGYSYQTVADKVGSCSKSYIADIEKGKYAVSVELGLAICQLLEIDIELCMDYIATVEIDRIKKELQSGYQDWYDMTPQNVRDRMLATDTAKHLHYRFTGEQLPKQKELVNS